MYAFCPGSRANLWASSDQNSVTLVRSLGHSASGHQTDDLNVTSYPSGFWPVRALIDASAPQVHLCEADGLLEFLGVSSTEFTHQPVLVAVKMLRSDVNKTAR